jgi:4-hydroxythreonine-4-phosphate dehydrogenase
MTGSDALPLGLTLGEPAGICGEIACKAWLELRGIGPAFVVLGDPAYLRDTASALGLPVPVEAVRCVEDAKAVFGSALPAVGPALAAPAVPGRPDGDTARAVIESIEEAVRLAMAGRIGAVVTNPIHKASLYAAGFRHPGHTEFLAELAGGARPVMMLACEELRVVPVTVHLALGEAVRALTRDAIVTCGRITAAALERDFGIGRPRLAVAGLNPHAGESGHLGREEIELIEPAVRELRADGIAADGPFPADSLFHAAARRRFDAALCMYHDQALIPLKTIDFDGGVNATLGLPFVRTSPDHGTAFDIAGQGKANARSLIAALDMAGAMARHRAAAGAA